jgi:hypothetical protein
MATVAVAAEDDVVEAIKLVLVAEPLVSLPAPAAVLVTLAVVLEDEAVEDDGVGNELVDVDDEEEPVALLLAVVDVEVLLEDNPIVAASPASDMYVNESEFDPFPPFRSGFRSNQHFVS